MRSPKAKIRSHSKSVTEERTQAHGCPTSIPSQKHCPLLFKDTHLPGTLARGAAVSGMAMRRALEDAGRRPQLDDAQE